MPRYVQVNRYESCKKLLMDSKEYKSLSQKGKKLAKSYLESYKSQLENLIVPQLTLHESVVEAFANSPALRKRAKKEQDAVLKILQDPSSKQVWNNLEKELLQLGH